MRLLGAISICLIGGFAGWARTTAMAQDSELDFALQRIKSLENRLDALSNPGVAPFVVPAGHTFLGAEAGCRSGQCAGGELGCNGCRNDASVGGSAAKGNRLHAVYDSGFVLRPDDAVTTPFEMKINSWLQLRHSVFSSDGPNSDQNEFEFERARLNFSGFAFTEDLQYFMQIDADDDQTQRLDLLDFYLSYDIGHNQLGMDQGRIGVRAGRWKIPFNRSRFTSGLNLQFADRSMAGLFFDIDRSVGVSLYGTSDTAWSPLNWEVALINGIRTNGTRPSRAGELDRNLGISGRVYSDVLGTWGTDHESDVTWHEEFAARLGAGFAFARENIEDGPVEAAGQRVVDSGATLISLLPATARAYSVGLFALSADFRYYGWSLSTEYYFRSLSSFSGASVPDLFDHGFLIQSGYFIIPKKLELISRWSRIVGDSGSLGVSDQSADEVAGGVAWYIKGSNLKFVFDVSRVNGTPFNESAAGYRPGDDGLQYRTQFQFSF